MKQISVQNPEKEILEMSDIQQPMENEKRRKNSIQSITIQTDSSPSGRGSSKGSDESSSEESDATPVQEMEREVVFSGYLFKKSDLSGEWKKRWMICHKWGPIYYFDDQQDNIAKGVIILKGAKLYPVIEKNGEEKRGYFSIFSTGKDFLLKTDVQKEKKKWIKILTENITKIGPQDREAIRSGSLFSGSFVASRDQINNMFGISTPERIEKKEKKPLVVNQLYLPEEEEKMREKIGGNQSSDEDKPPKSPKSPKSPRSSKKKKDKDSKSPKSKKKREKEDSE